MRDTTLERSLIAIFAIAIVWILAGIISKLLPPALVVIIGIIIALVGGGTLIYYWGKNSMLRR